MPHRIEVKRDFDVSFNLVPAVAVPGRVAAVVVAVARQIVEIFAQQTGGDAAD